MQSIGKITFFLFAIIDVAFSDGMDIYWNIPTSECQRYGINFTDVERSGDQIIGDKISTIDFPDGKLIFPHELVYANFDPTSNCSGYVDKFKKELERQVPDVHSNGIIVISFAMCYPIFRQNVGLRDLCKFCTSNDKELEEASEKYYKAARHIMETIFKLAKELRPAAKWGAHNLPLCLNDVHNENCSSETRAENDQLHWLFEATDVVVPALFINEHHQDAQDRPKVMRGRIHEAVRVAQQQKHQPPVIAYVYLFYSQTMSKFLSKDDLQTVFETSKQAGASGLIFSSHGSYVYKKKKCIEFEDYLKTTLGPVAAQYAKPIVRPVPPML